MHAGLPELVGELLPHEEVKQLPGLGHHHLVARHIVQSLEVFNMNTSLSQNTDFSKNRLTLLTRHVLW